MPEKYPGFMFERAGGWRFFRNRVLQSLNTATPNTAMSTTTESPISRHLSQQQAVASSHYSHVCKATLNNGGEKLAVYFKGMDFKSPRDAIKQQLSKSRAIKAFEAELLLQSLGFGTPSTLLTGWRQRLFFKDSFFTLSAALIDYDDLYTTVAQVGTHSSSQKRVFIKQLATTIARMHKENIAHGDLRAGNVMCRYSESWQFSFLDNERTRQYKKLPDNIRIKNLVQLNLLFSPLISKTDRQRFFYHYSLLCYGQTNKDLLSRVVNKTRKRLKIMLDKKKIEAADLWL